MMMHAGSSLRLRTLHDMFSTVDTLCSAVDHQYSGAAGHSYTGWWCTLGHTVLISTLLLTITTLSHSLWLCCWWWWCQSHGRRRVAHCYQRQEIDWSEYYKTLSHCEHIWWWRVKNVNNTTHQHSLSWSAHHQKVRYSLIQDPLCSVYWLWNS